MELFQIGEMARLFHLSVSSIRHYETLGLVTPERIDPDTGYRYYSVRQFEAFNTIRYLRTLDMPLPEIADFLRNRDVDKIEEKLQAQKAAVAEKQRELARIEHKIDARFRQLREVQTAPLGEIQLVLAPACRLFWMDASLSAENYSDLELSTSRFAAMQAEAVVFLGRLQHLRRPPERPPLHPVRRHLSPAGPGRSLRRRPDELPGGPLRSGPFPGPPLTVPGPVPPAGRLHGGAQPGSLRVLP